MKQNTFFAAATWYDDDDSQPYHSHYRPPLKGTRCYGDGDPMVFDRQYKLTGKYIASYRAARS